MFARLLPPIAVVAALALVPGPLAGAADPSIENTERPSVSGSATYNRPMTATSGRWNPGPASVSYQWLRAGEAIGGATEAEYRPGKRDLGKRLSVRVTVTDAEGNTGEATSKRSKRIKRATMRNRRAPLIRGDMRFGRTVKATKGRWTRNPKHVKYQWMRAGKPIPGATGKRYRFAPADVGKKIRVRVTVNAAGFTKGVAWSKNAQKVGHRVKVRKVATYSIATRGRITASVKKFAKQASQTLGDARGWRGGGTEFRRVPSGGGFTLVLAEAGTITSFSSQCSNYYSCRVGRFVIINQDRWKFATPPWNAAGRSLRDYRHMVVNHEVGHWLGRGHRGCPKKGQKSPVMAQQSKGTGGCSFNPWPRLDEL